MGSASGNEAAKMTALAAPALRAGMRLPEKL
jgi:hypothetical protein